MIENDEVEQDGCPLIYLIEDYDEFRKNFFSFLNLQN